MITQNNHNIGLDISSESKVNVLAPSPFSASPASVIMFCLFHELGLP